MENSCDYMGAAKVSCGQQHALRTPTFTRTRSLSPQLSRYLSNSLTLSISLSLSQTHTVGKKHILH